MSLATVASSLQPSHSFDIDLPSHMSAESPSSQRNNRAPRQRQARPPSQSCAEAQSDSTLVTTHTPKPKKNRQRQNDNKTMSGGEGPNPRTAAKAQRSKPMLSAKDSPTLSATPAKNLAYASAAFHQSPAASSLPMPKFLSKSVPAPAPENSLQARLDHDPEKSSQSPSPPAAATPEPLSRMKSPMDIFFNADRQERAQKKSMTPLPNGQFSPFLPDRTPPGTNKDLFSLEGDNSESPVAARLARPNLAPRISSAPGSVPNQQDVTAAATQSLKDFLNLSSNQQPTPPQHHQHYTPQQPPTNPSPAHPYLSNPFVASTPQQQTRINGYESPLHYGNRNLSPLFQAARTPNGSSTPPVNTTSPLQNRQSMNQPQPFDPKAFLDQHVRSASMTSNPTYSPAQAQRHPNGSFPDPRYFSPASNPPHPASGVPLNHNLYNNSNASPTQRQPPATSSDAPAQYDGPADDSDVKEMEAKLRNILKLG